MPRSWSAKDERKYEKIRRSQIEEGTSQERAEEIAARTVNRDRREEGRTKSGLKSTMGIGNPNKSLEERTRRELYNRAKQLHIEGRSGMTKAELVRAIRKR
ncbi:MAG TPA: Rho termination factor N-terminal domain-containing protein [Gemmatimonadota bacterium]|nr:Rho termination factor N-terminal domain-containing protein [Gemmatimonadota bacterium]